MQNIQKKALSGIISGGNASNNEMYKNEILIYLDISQIEAIIQRKQPLYKKLLGKINLFYIQNFSSKGVQL